MAEKIRFHSEYVSSFDAWSEIDNFVDGSNSKVSRYLIPFGTESGTSTDAQAALAGRLRRLGNQNECLPIREVLTSYLGQQVNFAELEQSSALKAIIDDATGFESSAQDIFVQLIKHYLDHGRVGVLVEGPRDIAPSLGEAEELAERSYQVLYTALEIKNWEFFTTGKNRGKLSQVLLTDRTFVDLSGKEFRQFIRYIYRGGETFYRVEKLRARLENTPTNFREEMDVEVLSSIPGSLDRIPFVLIGKGLCDSAMRIPAAYNKKLLNDRSSLDNIHYLQSSQRIIVAGTTGDKIRTMSEHTVTCIPEQDATVHVINPGDPSSLSQSIEKLEVKLRRFGMKQHHQIVSDGTAQVQSAESKSLDMKALQAWLNAVLDMFQKKLTQIYALHAQFEGEIEPQGITIPRDFGLEDVTAKDKERGSVFTRAGQLGVRELQKQILLQQVQEMRDVVPDTGEDIEQAKERLMTAVRESEDIPQFDFNGFAQRPRPVQ